MSASSGEGLRKPASRRLSLSLGGLVFALALLARTANLPAMTRGGAVGPFDDLYHAYRIEYSASHPGHVLDFDTERGVGGSLCPWPPLYDLLAGMATRLLAGPSPDRELAVMVWFPVLFESLFAAVVAAWLTRRRGVFPGLLAGAALAIAPAGIRASRVGAIDHHFLEPALLVGIIASTARAIRARTGQDTIFAAGLLALALVSSLFIQVALLLAAAVACFAILLFADRREVPVAAAAGFGLSAGAVFAYRALQGSSYPDDEWHLGNAHAAGLLGATVACLVLALLLSRRVSRSIRLPAAIAIGALAAFATPHAAQGLLAGSRFFGGDPWLATIIEFQPIFFAGWKSVPDGLLELGGGLLLAAPLLALHLRRTPGIAAVLLLFAAVYTGATISSQRFLLTAVSLLALTGAAASSALLRSRGRRAATIAAAVLLLPWLGRSVGEVLRPPPNVPAEADPFLRAAAAIRDRGPGRVLGPWSWGHVFHIVGQRGVLVDGFGASIGRGAFENALGAVLVTREDFVADFCRRSGVRWVVLDNPVTHLTVQAQAIGLSAAHFVRGKPARIMPRMRFTFWWRAYFDQGRAVREPTRISEPFRRFRLAYSDPQLSTGGPARYRGPAVQVWELVDSPEQPRR